jgi:hypothetical protein
LYPVGVHDGTAEKLWDHYSDLKKQNVKIWEALQGGLVRALAFQWGQPGKATYQLAFEFSVDGLNPTTLEEMVNYASRFRGKFNNELSVEVWTSPKHKDQYRFLYNKASEVKPLIQKAVKLSRGTAMPAINKQNAEETHRRKLEREKRAAQRAKREVDRAFDRIDKASTPEEQQRRRYEAEEKIADRAWRQSVRDFKKKLTAMKKDSKNWRKKLNKLIRDELPMPYRGRMLTALAGVDNKTSYEKAVKKLVKEIDLLAFRKEKARLKKFMRKFGKKYGFRRKQGYKKGMKFKVSTPISKAFEQIFDSIQLTRAKSQDAVAGLRELLDYAVTERQNAERQRDLGVPSENPFLRFEINKTIEDLIIKLRKKSIQDMSIEELATLTDTLETTLAEYEWARSDEQARIEQQREKDTVDILEEVASTHKKKRPERRTSKAFQKGVGRLKSKYFWAGLFGRFNYNLQTLVKIMSGAQEGVLYKRLVRGLQIGRDNEKAHIFQMMDDLHLMMKEHGITAQDIMEWSHYGKVRDRVLPPIVERYLEKYMPEIKGQAITAPKTIRLLLETEGGQEMDLSVAEALGVLMHMRNEFGYQAIKANGVVFRNDPTTTIHLTDNDIDMIHDAIPEKARAMVNIMDTIITEQQDAINVVSNVLYGYNLANVDGYWHLRRYRVKGVRGATETGPTRQTIESRSHWQERLGGTDPIYIDDAFNELVDTVKVGGEFVGLAIPMQEARAITNNKEIVHAIQERGYGEYFKDVVELIDKLQEHPVGLNWWQKLYGAWARNITRAVFGLNLRVSAQQYFSVMLAPTELGMNHFGDIRGVYSKELVDRAGRWSPMLRERFMGAITRELGDVAQTGGVMRFFTGNDQLLNLPTFFVRVFDKMAVLDVWRMAEAKVMEDKRYKGATQEQLIKEAELPWTERRELDRKRGTEWRFYKRDVVREAEEAIRITQPTWDIIDRSLIGATKDPMVKALTMFHSQREKLAQILGLANSRYMNTLEGLRRKHQLTSLKQAALTEEGMRELAKASRTYALVLVNTSLVKAWGVAYGVILMGRDDDPTDWAIQVAADIPGMYYFGDIGRDVAISWGKKMRGKKTYQLGAYEPPPLRAVTTAKRATYEMGNLLMMLSGAQKATRSDVRKQMWRTLDRTWETANYTFGGPFQHVTNIVTDIGGPKTQASYKSFKGYKK